MRGAPTRPPLRPSALLLLARRSRDAWLLAAGTFLLAASFASFFGWNQLRVDATAYWQAGMHLRTGQPLYSLVAVPALEKAYLYPPAFAAAFAPLTALPPLWGYACWMALEVVFAVALARTAAALAGIAPQDTEARRTALALALAAGIVPVYDNLAEGQVNLLVAWLSCVAVLEAERGRDRRAAFALAAAVHIKIVPIVLAGAFAVWRRSGVVRWFTLALVALGLLPLAWRVATMGMGPGTGAFGRDYVDFWHAILWPAASADHVAGVEQLFAPNFSLRATLSRLFVEGTALSPFPGQAARRGPLLLALPPPLVHATSIGLGLGGITAALWTCQRSGDDRRRRVAAAGLLLLAGALAAPSFWEHHFVTLALAGAGLWSVLAARSRYARLRSWVCLLAPLVATITVPFFVALFSAGFEGTFYLALREYGFPTAAAVNVLVLGIVETIRLQSVNSSKGPLGCSD
jgi:hypothetical protein